MESISQCLTDNRCLIYDDFLSFSYPKYLNSLLEQNMKQLHFILLLKQFTEKDNLSPIDQGDPRAPLYWKGCHFESTPNCTGRGVLHQGIYWRRKMIQSRQPVHARRITISSMETRLLRKVFPINTKAEALYVSLDKQLSHFTVGHEM